MAFRFHFDPHQPHQVEAVAAVVDLFEGLSGARLGPAPEDEADIVANAPLEAGLAAPWLEENLHRVQRRHDDAHPDAKVPVGPLEIEEGPLLDGVSTERHACPHFTLEMETGTGKTYVYLRTALELFSRYGLKKFVVVVPSVAILEGVKKTIDVTRAHFQALYGVTHLHAFVYDGEHLSRIGSFARSPFPALLVVTQQAFNKASNTLYKRTEKLAGDREPHRWIQATRPVVILDEPQNMGSERSKAALRTLRPLFVLRYSATHRAGEQPNPVYRLTPVQASRLGLVKQIEVVGVAQLGLPSANLLQLEGVRRGPPLQARVRVLTLHRGEATERVVTLRHGSDLRRETALDEHEGLTVADIRYDADGGTVELEGGPHGGLVLSRGEEIVGSRVDVWRAQIEQTIDAHFRRQEELRGLGVKVLSLFFVDRVNNYVGEPGTLRRLFDEAFDRKKRAHPAWRDLAAEDARSGYFARHDADGPDEARAALAAAFDLILRDKETLLSFPDGTDERKRVAFLFAHSALKEGWDNPNVFQICTLNQTTSTAKKRQEIGRGLRLCVDQAGDRPAVPGLNVLTVIANERYESYVERLQQDYVDDGDIAPPPPRRRTEATRALPLPAAPSRRPLPPRVDTEALIAAAVARLDASTFAEPTVTVSRGRFVLGGPAVGTEAACAPAERARPPIPDFVARAAAETSLTRETLIRIFEGAAPATRAALFCDPEGWTNMFVKVVKRCLAAQRAAAR